MVMNHTREIRLLDEQIGAIYGHALFQGRDVLSDEEVAQVMQLSRRIMRLRSLKECPRTGPYETKNDVLRVLANSNFARLIGRVYVVRNSQDGTWAWYCDTVLFRRGDVLQSTMEYDYQHWRWNEWPTS